MDLAVASLENPCHSWVYYRSFMRHTRCLMATFCQEVQEFIRVSEAIHGLLASGRRLTADEREVLEQCAIELLSKLGSDS